MRPAAAWLMFPLVCAGPPAHAAAHWWLVPGTEALHIDLASVRQDGGKVQAWLRGPRASTAGGLPSAIGGPPGNTHRIASRLEFHCGARTARTLAAMAHDVRGTAVWMASTPGAQQPVPEGDLTWAYDAVCESLRSGGRP